MGSDMSERIADQMKKLADDFNEYEEIITSESMRNDMQRAVVVEMEFELKRLREHCKAR